MSISSLNLISCFSNLLEVGKDGAASLLPQALQFLLTDKLLFYENNNVA